MAQILRMQKMVYNFVLTWRILKYQVYMKIYLPAHNGGKPGSDQARKSGPRHGHCFFETRRKGEKEGNWSARRKTLQPKFRMAYPPACIFIFNQSSVFDSNRPTGFKDSHRNRTLFPKKDSKGKIAAMLGLDQTILVVSGARKAH